MNKRISLTCIFAMAAILTVSAQDDDLYFTPARKKAKQTDVPAAVTPAPRNVTVVNAARPQLEVYNTNSRNDDEYNRRGNYSGTWQTSGGAGSDSLAAEVDTIREYGRYDLDDPELDYTYSRRILRFHSPRVGYYVSSPYYWDLVYGYGVYDYFYDPFYYDFYDPFYWNYGWGYGYAWGPWASWYSPLWGWYTPHYHWATWGYGPAWHSSSHYASLRPRTIGPRNGGISPVRNGQGLGIRTSALAANSATRQGTGGISLARTTPRTSASAELQQRTGTGLRTTTTGRGVTTVNGRTSAVRTNAADGQRQSSTRVSVNQRPTETQRTTTVQRSNTTVQRTNTVSAPRTTTVSPSSSSGMSSGGFGGGASRGGGGVSGGISRGGGRR